MICLALKFPRSILVITSSTCAAKQVALLTAWLNSPLSFSLFSRFISLSSDLSENQIQGVPRKAFRGAVEIKNL
ncbi:Slit like 2 protein, partial [Dissostichus eleginoides]